MSGTARRRPGNRVDVRRPAAETGRVSRTVSAWVTCAGTVLGRTGPFAVEPPWWAETGSVAQALERELGVAVVVLRLLEVAGGGGSRDGHVTYHAEASAPPAPGPLRQEAEPPEELTRHEDLRARWARPDGVRELLDWARDRLASMGRPLTGPPRQQRSWNLSGLFRLPTAQGPVWLKATAPFAADEAVALREFARAAPGLVPDVLASGEGRVLLAHVPGEDCWDASPATAESGVRRFVAAQARLAARPRPAGLRDGRGERLTADVHALLDRTTHLDLTADERDRARELAQGWRELAGCGLPDTLVHGDFHPGNWRSDGGPPVVVDFADSFWGNPALDAPRLLGFLSGDTRPAAARAWTRAWTEHAPGSDPERALRLATPLTHLALAVRYQEFLDGIEPSERRFHQGDPESSVRAALRAPR